MSHLAKTGLAKTDSLTGIRKSKRVGRPADDPSSVEVADIFFRSPIGGRALETAMKLVLDYIQDRSAGGTVGAAIDCSGLTVTPDSVQIPIAGAVDGSTMASSSLAILTPTDGTSVGGNIVEADNAITGFGAITDGTSGCLVGTDWESI